MELSSPSKFHSTQTTPQESMDLFASKSQQLPLLLLRHSKMLIATRQSSISHVTSVTSERSITTSMPRTSHLTGVRLRYVSFLASMEELSLYTSEEMRGELMLLSVSILKTDLTVSMVQSALKTRSKRWTDRTRSMELNLSTRNCTSKKPWRREIAKLSVCVKPSSTRAQRKDATFMSKDSQRLPLSKSWRIFSPPTVRLRVSSSSLQVMESRNFTPSSALRSQMRHQLLRKNSTTLFLEEGPWLSTTMRSRKLERSTTKQPRIETTSRLSVLSTTREPTGLDLLITRTSSTTLSCFLRVSHPSSEDSREDQWTREAWEVQEPSQVNVNMEEVQTRTCNQDLATSNTVVTLTTELATTWRISKLVEWVVWEEWAWLETTCNQFSQLTTWLRPHHHNSSRCLSSNTSSSSVTRFSQPWTPPIQTTKTRLVTCSSSLSRSSLVLRRLQRSLVCLLTCSCLISDRWCQTGNSSPLVLDRLMRFSTDQDSSESPFLVKSEASFENLNWWWIVLKLWIDDKHPH